MVSIPNETKSVAIALGTHTGSIVPNSALKPNPMPIAVSDVRTHPLNVRSFASNVLSSASSVRSCAGDCSDAKFL